jgi:hypothetical protein
MVTGDEELKYGYLLDPCFQIVNTAGKPLTQGWIEVYIAGTRNKYYCSSDFAGTLHPFKIPLDSLGSNIIRADVAKSYDVYVYNRFGNLAMSRYNITPGKGGAGGSISGSGIAEHWIGKNGQNRSIPASTDTALKLPTSFEYEGSFIDRINENRTAFYLKEGLYLVQAVVNFKQSDQSLTNEISQVDVFTRSDNAPEDMSFNRDMAGPDSSDDRHCLKVSFIRCVKEDDEVSQIVLFKVNTPNAWSECYLQNVQIARLSSGGAGTGGQTYYAGDYIAIDEETNTISVTGIDPDSYATHDEVEQAIESATSAFITSADLPDLSSYATEQWVLEKHYITSADIPDIPEDLVTSAELAQTSGLIEQDIADLTSAISEALSDKMDKSSSADFYPRYDNPEGYLTSIPSEYVTDSEMSAYVQDHTSGFITSADIPTQIEYSAGDNIDITDHVVSVTDTSQLIAGDNVIITPSGNDYIISARASGSSGYVTEQEMNDAIQSATSAFITSADIPPLPEDLVTSGELATVSGEIVNQIPSLQGYATEEYVTEHTSAFITSADLPDVSDMATKTWVGEQGYLTSIPSEYVTDIELESELSGKADTSAIPDVSNFVTQEDIDAAVSGKMDATESSAFYPMATNPSGYLTSEDVDLSDYIPYSAAGVDLPNSKFSIDTSGQAYKKTNTPVALKKDSFSTPTNTRIVCGFEVVEGDIITINGIADGCYDFGITVSPTVGDAVYYELTIQSDENGNHASWTVDSTFNGKTISSIDAYDRITYIGNNTSATILYVNGIKYVTEDTLSDELSSKMDSTESSAFYPIYSNPNEYMTKFQADSYYIPYSVAGVDLPNSNFSIDVSGQAYKKFSVTNSLTIDSISNRSFTISNAESLSKIQPSSKLIINNISNSGGSYPLVSVTIIDTGYRTLFSLINASVTNGTLEVDIPSDFNEYGMTLKRMEVEGSPSYYPMGTDVTVDVEGKVGSPYALESYVDSAVSGKQDTLTFSYDSSDKISAINGSAIAGGGGGGGGHEYSGANGVYVDNVNEVIGLDTSASNAIETVIENSGAWGGAGLPISAGPGINVALENGVLMISKEEPTLLYSGTSGDARSGTFTLSESCYNFERIELTSMDVNNYVIKQVADIPNSAFVNSNGTRGSWFNSVTDGNSTWFKAMNWSINQAGTTLNYWVDEIVSQGNSITGINRNQTGNRPIMLRIYGIDRR